MNIKKILSILVVFAVVFSFMQVVTADIEETRMEYLYLYAEELHVESLSREGEFATGALRQSSERHAEFRENVPGITYVRLNSLAISRIKEQQENVAFSDTLLDIVPAELGEEFISDRDSILQEEIEFSTNNLPLPIRVDNSRLRVGNTTQYYFPPIKNQGSINSCNGWATTYFMMTHNINRVRGLPARNANGTGIYANILSPMWTYNLINGGRNQGTFAIEAMNVAYSFGAANWTDIHGTNTSPGTNVNTWFPGATIWENALNNRTDVYYIAFNPYAPATLDNIRRLLANGYVVTFGTYFRTWRTARSNCALNEWVTTSVEWRNTSFYNNSGHFMTIVGYDDTVWVDLNGNGQRDPGEMGAFKVANSHGTGFRNDGFVWLSYDALRSVSAVA